MLQPLPVQTQHIETSVSPAPTALFGISTSETGVTNEIIAKNPSAAATPPLSPRIAALRVPSDNQENEVRPLTQPPRVHHRPAGVRCRS